MRGKRVRKRKRPCRAAIVLLMSSSPLVAGRALGAVANWLNPVDGNWTDPTKWSTNPIYPHNGADSYQVIIGVTGTPYTATFDAGIAGGIISVDSVTLNSADATMIDTVGILNSNIGGALTITAGKFQLNGGTLRNFVVSGADNSFFPSIGTLDHVTLTGNVTADDGFPTYGMPLTIVNGLTLNSATFYSRPGVVFPGVQTIAGTGNARIDSQEIWAVQSGGKLTIDSGILIHGGGELNYHDASIVNLGTIRAEPDIAPLTFDTSATSANLLTNRGLMESVTGARLEFDGAFTNVSGTIRANGGSVLFAAPNYKTVDLGTLQAAGGTVGGSIAFGGTLDNHNATLTTTATTGSMGIVGTISGGTLASADGTEFKVGRTGSIFDVTVSGDVSVYPEDLTNHGTLNFKNLTLAGGTIHLKALATTGSQPGVNAHLHGSGPAQTINGTGQILFEGASNANAIEAAEGPITLAAGIVVKTTTGGGTVGANGFTTTNLGTIISQTPGRTITLTNVTNQGTIKALSSGTLFSNTLVNTGTIGIDAGTLTLSGFWRNSGGTISASNSSTVSINSPPDTGNFGAFTLNGSTLNFGTTVTTAQLGQISLTNSTFNLTSTGIIDNTGGTTNGAVLNLGASNILDLLGGRINGGTVLGVVQLPSGNSTFKGVTLATPLTIQNGGILRVESGLNLNGAQISLGSTANSYNTGLQFMDAVGLSGTGQIVFDGTSSMNMVKPTGSLTIPAGITIRTGVAGGSIGTANATLTNSGLVSAQTSGQTITLLGTNLANPGVLEAKNGGSLVMSFLQNTGTLRVGAGSAASLGGSWASTGPIQLNDGLLTLGGNFSSSSLATLVRSGSNSTVVLTGTIFNTGTTIDLAKAGPLVLSGFPRVIGGSITGSAAASLSGSGTSLQFTLDGVENHVPVNLSGGATLTLMGNWTNAAAITLTDSTLNLGGNFTRAGLGTINRTGGIVNFSGALDNSNSVLALDDATGTWTVQGGAITGGTIRTSGSARFYIPSGSVMTLKGVALDTDLSLAGSQLIVSSGLSFPGRQIYGNGRVTFSGSNSQTLQSGTLAFYDSTSNLIENTGAAVARLGSDLLVHSEYLSITGGSAGIINQGTIRSLAPLGSLFISNLLNQGTIEIQTGGVFGTTLSPSNTARIVLNSGLVQFTGPRAQVFGALDNTATGRVVISAGADATFNGPLSGTAGTELRIEAGGLAKFGSAITGPIKITGDGAVSFVNGNSSISPLTVGSIEVQAQAIVTTNQVQARTLTVNGELDINGTPTGTLASRVNQLNIGTEGVFNLGNNGLIVDYDPGGSSPRADIRSRIISRQIAGTGDFDSAPTVLASQLAVGYAEASRVLSPSGGIFMGQPVDGSAVLIRYTLLGDTNLNAKVDFADLVTIAQNYGKIGTAEWSDGDVNLDGNTDFADLVAVAQDYGLNLLQTPVPGASPEFEHDLSAAMAAVPEPGALCLLGMASWLWFGRRRKRGGAQTLKMGGLKGGLHA